VSLPRLSLATLTDLPGPSRADYDPRAVHVRLVHLGIGAFHRAHQAVYTELAREAGQPPWGICGVTQRSRTVIDQLEPQDGLYSVLERGPGAAPVQIVGTVREVLSSADDWPAVSARLADPRIKVVSLTVTEKGYRHIPSTGRLHFDDAVQVDLEGGPPTTVVGQLVRGLQQRRRADAGSVSLLSCDNLPGNGRVLRSVVTDFVAASGPDDGLSDWIGTHVGFPSTMVDRIVPATTLADFGEVDELLGVHDAGAVVTEPFRMWVIEDSFAAARPAWETAGALLVDDVTPYEVMKLRMLNGSHSTVAYLGALADFQTVSDAISNPGLGAAIEHLMRAEMAPTLVAPAGIDLATYRAQLLARFANPSLPHLITQIAADGSQKLPQRLLYPLRERRDRGESSPILILAIAAWMRFVWLRRSDRGDCIEVTDPLADQFATLLAGVRAPADAVDRLLSIEAIFGSDLTTLHDQLTVALTALVEQGVPAGVAQTLSSV
jgi:fructuronate reductase